MILIDAPLFHGLILHRKSKKTDQLIAGRFDKSPSNAPIFGVLSNVSLPPRGLLLPSSAATIKTNGAKKVK
jgi:hypothetical protein